MMTEIQFTVAAKNGKDTRLVVATLGEKEFRDTLNTDSSTSRERFLRKAAERFDVDAADLLKAHEPRLSQLALAVDLEAAQVVAAETAPRPARTRVESTSGRPKIDTSCKDLSIITGQAWSALVEANDPPSLFRYGGVASRIESGDEGEPIIKPLTEGRMRYALARSANWTEWKKSGDDMVEHATMPPMDVVYDVLATPDIKLPILTRIVEAPVFALDGSLQTTPGYHPRSQTYYVPAAGFTVPNVSDHPDSQDIEVAQRSGPSQYRQPSASVG